MERFPGNEMIPSWCLTREEWSGMKQFLGRKGTMQGCCSQRSVLKRGGRLGVTLLAATPRDEQRQQQDVLEVVGVAGIWQEGDALGLSAG